MSQPDIIKRIEEICNELDDRVTKVGLTIARLELAKAFAEAESAQPLNAADCKACPLYVAYRKSCKALQERNAELSAAD